LGREHHDVHQLLEFAPNHIMTPFLFIWFLAVADVLGVVLGYQGIAKLHEQHLYPFWGRSEMMHTILIPFPLPPNWLIYDWDSGWGWLVLTLGCVLAPLVASNLVGRRNQVALGVFGMIVWTVSSSLVGFWIWMETFFNVAV
jgi:hypothetical protein